MRYRQLDPSGDYVIGQPFLVDSPACVRQAVLTRLKLWQGEWFVDVTDGTPYKQQILGKPNNGNPDAAIKQRILGTPGVSSIVSYSSTFDAASRSFSVQATIQTQFGTAAVQAVL